MRSFLLWCHKWRMATEAQLAFLTEAAQGARAAGHPFPDMAACEAALESTWGTSQLALNACNLFGQKANGSQESISLPTQEFLGGKWVTVLARWVRFHSLQESFAARIDLIRRAAGEYPQTYGAALHAQSAEEFVTLVSKTWSTDPARAAKCKVIYNAHKDTLEAALAQK